MKERNRIPHILPMDLPEPPADNAIISDPMGSYTGLVKDLAEKPVQDADDL